MERVGGSHKSAGGITGLDLLCVRNFFSSSPQVHCTRVYIHTDPPHIVEGASESKVDGGYSGKGWIIACDTVIRYTAINTMKIIER